LGSEKEKESKIGALQIGRAGKYRPRDPSNRKNATVSQRSLYVKKDLLRRIWKPESKTCQWRDNPFHVHKHKTTE
jgi:hypothetical protein